MSHGESKTAIYTAAGANLSIAAAKFTGAGLTGSAAMFAEGVHSVVDTTNQILLLVGIAKSGKPADAKHPFGYARELYFYAFVVALFIFSGGGAFAIYEGIHKIQAGDHMRDAVIFGTHFSPLVINVAILGFGIVVEGYSFFVAARIFAKEKGDASAFRALRDSKDPALYTILLEDFAALGGLVIALAGVVSAELLGLPWLDGAASIVIGVLLIFAAVFLMVETHALIIGEAADPKLIRRIQAFVDAEPGVMRVNEVLTQHLGPNTILANISLDFDDARTAGEVEAMVSHVERELQEIDPRISRIFVEVQASPAVPAQGHDPQSVR